ncbi:MAG: NAD(P)/FAD-dependent oxidoreductase [Candidatus Humimicrobiaceae bacterium]
MKIIKDPKPEIYDLIIIGAGPAGIAAGIYAARKKMSVLLLEKYFEVGGQLIKNAKIDNYPGSPEVSGFELAQNLKKHLVNFDVTILEEKVLKLENSNRLFEAFTEKNIYKSKSILIATGMEEKRSGAANEEKFIGRGISFCATCDAPLYKDKIVGIYGSGSEAEKTVLELLPFAKTVYFITNKEYDNYYLEEVKKNVKSGNILIRNNTRIKSFEGEENLEKVSIITGGKIEELMLEGFFINLGYTPVTVFVSDILKINDKNEIVIDLINRTSLMGVFAAGDCTNYPYKQVITATAQGAAAALSSYRYLHGL